MNTISRALLEGNDMRELSYEEMLLMGQIHMYSIVMFDIALHQSAAD